VCWRAAWWGRCWRLSIPEALLRFLDSIWHGDGDGPLFRFHAGSHDNDWRVAGFTCLMMAVIWLVHAQASAPKRQPAARGWHRDGGPHPRQVGRLVGIGFAGAGIAALLAGRVLGPQGAFFLRWFRISVSWPRDLPLDVVAPGKLGGKRN